MPDARRNKIIIELNDFASSLLQGPTVEFALHRGLGILQMGVGTKVFVTLTLNWGADGVDIPYSPFS